MSQLMLAENPYFYPNPRRRRRRRRNPKGLGKFMGGGTVKRWTKGVGLMDGVMAAVGLAAAAYVPGMVVKAADPAVGLTTTQKFLKVGVALGCAVAAGAAADAFGFGARGGQFAVAGGLAGTASQAIGIFTTWSNPFLPRTRVANRPQLSQHAPQPSQMGRYPAPAYSTEFQGITLD